MQEARMDLLLKDAMVYQNVDNYRQGRALIQLAQKALDDMGRNLKINAVRDIEGSVLNGGFYEVPIDLTVDTMVLFRMRAHLLAAYSAMLSLSIPVVIIGQKNTATQLLDLIGDSDGSLSRIQTIVDIKVKRLEATQGASEVYDLYVCLAGVCEMFQTENPNVDPTLPESATAFKEYVYNFFMPKKDLTGVVRLSTIHTAKGLKATRVYIAQGELLPLADRVAKGGWNAHEERCAWFVCLTRGADCMVFLRMLDRVTRATFLTLFEKPNDLSEEIPSSQDTEATMQHESENDPNLSPEENEKTAITEALRVMNLQALPENKTALTSVVKSLLFRAHPDRNFNSQVSKEYTQTIIAARAVLLRALESGGDM